ncbi:hypothetical protein F2P79_022456 [Pimephales promelas]|nr:hypothetical protein F2P79_022456 [Pimephales promelas]
MVPLGVLCTVSLMFPDDLRKQNEYFQSLYKVGRKLDYNYLVHSGMRRSDGKKVVIKFFPKCRCGEKFEKNNYNVKIDLAS